MQTSIWNRFIHARQVARLDQPQRHFSHADRHGLASRAAAHVRDDRQENSQRDDLSERFLVEGNNARCDDIQHDVDA